MAAVHGLHNDVNSTFAPLTLFFVVSVQQQHAKIHLCHLTFQTQFRSGCLKMDNDILAMLACVPVVPAPNSIVYNEYIKWNPSNADPL